MAMDRSTVVGVFRDRDKAEDAIDELHSKGFSDADIGFAMRGGEGAEGATTTDTGSQAGTGAITGIVAGAGVGGVIAAAAAMLIPGFGPVVAGGILATVLGGAAIGAAAGGILGALVGMGIPEEEARYYENEFNQGGILVTVKAGGRYQEARTILQQHGAYDIENRGATTSTAGMTGTETRPTTMATEPRTTGTTSDRDRESMRLHEERLQARTEPVQAGEVTVGKDVVTERQEMDVPVRREEVTVERRPIEGQPARGEIREGGEEIRVPVHEERVDVDKRTVAYEQVDVNTRQVQDTEHVAGDVRREEARIERHGDVPVREAGMSGMRNWNEISPQFRQTWQTRYGSQGGRYEDYEPYYRYGYEMSSDPRYQGRDWSQIEPDLRRNYGSWAQRNGYRADESGWDRFKDSVHDSWDSMRGRRAA
jgi:uncharacterized protein (TIGR02271 family)